MLSIMIRIKLRSRISTSSLRFRSEMFLTDPQFP